MTRSLAVSALAILLVCAAAIGLRASRDAELPKASSPRVESLADYYRRYIAFWEAHLARDPYSPGAMKAIAAGKLTLARAIGDEHLYDEVIAMLERSTPLLVPEDPDVPLLRARALMAKHRFHAALQGIEAALQRKPGHRGLRATRVDALQGLGRYEEALAELESCCTAKEDFGTAVRRATLLDVIGRDEESWSVLSQVETRFKIDEPESLAWLRLMRAAYWLKHDDLGRAEAELERSLAVAPDYYLAEEHLAEVFEKRKDYARAKPLLERAIATSRRPELLLRLADVREALGESDVRPLREEAERLLEANAARDPIAHGRDLAEHLLERNDRASFERALALSEQELAARPGDIRSNLVRAQALRKLGRTEEARPFIRAAARYPGSDEDVLEEAKALGVQIGL